MATPDPARRVGESPQSSRVRGMRVTMHSSTPARSGLSGRGCHHKVGNPPDVPTKRTATVHSDCPVGYSEEADSGEPVTAPLTSGSIEAVGATSSMSTAAPLNCAE